MKEKTYGKWKQLGVYSVIAVGIYIGIRCLLGAVFPFLAAIVLMKIFYPWALWLQKHFKIGKGIGVFLILIISMGIVGIGAWFVLRRLFEQLGEVFHNLPVYETYVDSFLEGCCCKVEQYFGLRAEYVRPYLLGQFYEIAERLGKSISGGLLSYSYQYAKGFIKVIGVVVVVIAVTVLLAKDYDEVRAQLFRSPFWNNIRQLKEKVFRAAFIYFRAQALLLLMISAVCVGALLLLGNRHALLIGCGIGLLDALPFFGTGSVLVPWAMIQLMRGRMFFAAVLGTVYLLCSVIREFMEPKLIGNKLGVLPVYIICTVYIGIVLYGVGGVVLGPVHALVTAELGRQWISEHQQKE